MASDLFLILVLGFLGSFGHCAGMCSPIAMAFSLNSQPSTANIWQQVKFHGLLNLGRLLSYGLTGLGIGAIASVLVAGGQLAGIDSSMRRGIAIATGLMLIGFGSSQLGIKFAVFKNIGITRAIHKTLSQWMQQLAQLPRSWTPLLLGITWGLMPCGFLYAAQIKAAETANPWVGGAIMLAFGLGTMPIMLGIGVFSSAISADQRSQLSQLGGWLTIAIGVLTIARSGDTMVDYTGHAAMFCLVLALIARPISHWWSYPLRYRRILGVGSFGLGVLHVAHMLEHSWGWNFRTILFMLPSHQVGMWAGITAILLLAPAAFTSFDGMVKRLGSWWRSLHLLAVPALLLVTLHMILVGSHYFGSLKCAGMISDCSCRVILLICVTGLVLALRSPWLVPLKRFTPINPDQPDP